jgi:peroxiredoxin
MQAKEIEKRRRINLQLISLGIFVFTGIGILIVLQTKDSSFDWPKNASIEKGRPAPDFTLPRPDGKMVSLADFRGKVVLINIWATWCPPCVAEMPSMEKLYQELQDEDFEILAVSIDESGANTVRSFMKQHRLSFVSLNDSGGGIASLYQTTGVPESFIVDKDGILVEKVIGPRDWATPGAIRFFRNLIKHQ